MISYVLKRAFLCLLFVNGVATCARQRAFRSPAPGQSETSSSACAELAETCHHHDAQSKLAHECHELGHSGTEEQCRDRRDECWNECNAALRRDE